MKSIAILSIVLLFFFGRSYSQRASAFTLQGTTNSHDSGRMILVPVNTEDYYPFHGTLVAPVVDGKFTFTDRFSYPVAFFIGFKYDSTWKYISSLFFVDSGVQTISCDINMLREVPAITNRTMLELKNVYNASFASLWSRYDRLDAARDSLKRVYKAEIPDSLRSRMSSIDKDLTREFQETFLSYVKNNPGSYVALWKLVNRFTSGYEPFYDSLYRTFSDSLRQTHTGKILEHKLDMGRISCIGCHFPDLKFISINDLSRKVSLSNRGSKYTLIDIWFSHCGPCIEQFPKLKEIYARFQKVGFQLIGISTDSKDQIQNWEKIIRQNTISWPQYLDENGTASKDLSIYSWPCNFLVDDKGIIIQRNISPKALEQFLNANIPNR